MAVSQDFSKSMMSGFPSSMCSIEHFYQRPGAQAAHLEEIQQAHDFEVANLMAENFLLRHLDPG